MTHELRARFWIEAALAGASGFLCVLTLAWRDWIEGVTGFDPDHGSGALEWAIVGALLIVTLVLGSLARVEWRRPAPAGA
jgi:hypothetical protein